MIHDAFDTSLVHQQNNFEINYIPKHSKYNCKAEESDNKISSLNVFFNINEEIKLIIH